MLAPLSFLVLYESGVAVFRSRALGVATLAGTLGLVAFASNAGGAFRSLALPATAGGRQLLVAASLALVFAYLREPSRARLALVAAAALVVAAVHPTYALFVLLLLGGFALARVAIVREDLRRVAAAAAVFAVAAGVFLAWLVPVVRDTASFRPDDVADRRHGIDRYPGQFVVDSLSSYHLAPAVVTRAGPVPVAALCLVPLAVFAARRRWAALVLGGTVAMLGVLLLDPVFPRFAEAVSLSQARRLAGFVPFAFAFAGGAAVLTRVLSWGVLPIALGAGIALERAWPGDFGYVLKEGGPTLPVWIASLGGLAALVAAVVLRRRLPELERRDWLPAAACALFVAPMLVTTSWARPRPAQELSPGLIEAVQDETRPGDVLLSDPVTSYWLAAYAPVYVVTSEPTHVGDTAENRPYERVREWERYRRTGSFEGRADWIVLDRKRSGGRVCRPRVYTDARYLLCRR